MTAPVSADLIDPMNDVRKATDELVADAVKQNDDHNAYLEKIKKISSMKGDQLAIALLFSIMANYPSQANPDATMTGFYEDKINLTGDGMTVMGKMTSFVNGMENQFSNTSGTKQDLKDFAHEADAFLAATDPDHGFLAKSKAIPPATLKAARDEVQKMRNSIYVAGVDPDSAKGRILSTDTSDSSCHSFAELYTKAQSTDDPSGRDTMKTFTQSFDSVSSIFDGQNSSLKLSLDQDTNDAKNLMSSMTTIGQSFFKPSDTAVNNSRP